jgi:hypothetical protein
VTLALDKLIDFLDLDFEDDTPRLDDEDKGYGDWIGDLWLSDEEREAERRVRALILPLESVRLRRGGRSFKESCLSYI